MQARDLDGRGLYTLLGLSIKATSADVKKVLLHCRRHLIREQFRL